MSASLSAGVTVGVLVVGVGLLAYTLAVARTGHLSGAPGTRESVVVFGCALVSGTLALLAHGAPTGASAVNAALRAGLAAGCVVAARVARPWALLVGGVTVGGGLWGVAHGGYEEALLLFCALIIAATIWLLPGHARIGSAIAGLAIGTAALRLPTSLPSRSPSLLAATAVGLIALSGTRHLPKTQRRRVGRATMLVCAVGASVAAAGATTLLSVRPSSQRGVDAAGRGLRLAREGDRAGAEQQLAAADTAIRATRARLRRPLARLGLLAPVIAQHLHAVDRLSDAGVNVLADATAASDDANLRAVATTGTAIDLEAVRRVGRSLAKTRTSIGDARLAVQRADGPWILPALSTRLDRFRSLLDESDRQASSLADVADNLPKLLGGDRDRDYLLLLPTPSEARGSGGLIGNYGVIHASKGVLSLDAFQRHLPPESSPGGPFPVVEGSPEFLARYSRFGVNSQTLVNVDMSPDFPSTARAAASVYAQIGGRPVDGVISIDPIALRGLLAVTGPVTVDGWPEPLSSDNVAQVLLNESYVQAGGQTPERIALLANVTQAAWAALGRLSGVDPSALVRALTPAATTRHLQLWMRDAAEQAYVARLGLSGAIPEPRGDGLGVVVNNAGGNKIDYYLRRRINYNAVVSGFGELRSTASVVLSNDAPSTGAPDYVIGNLVKVDPPPAGTNVVYLSLYSPLQLTELAVDGVAFAADQIEVDRELGWLVYSVWLSVPSKNQRTVVANFAGGSKAPLGYHLDLFTQPLVNADEVTLSVSMPGAGGTQRVRSVHSANPRSAETFEVDASGRVAGTMSHAQSP